MEFIATGPDETRGELGPPASKTQRTEGGAELPPFYHRHLKLPHDAF